ncbi:MAG: LLM class flavin-dependent oxidoreductase [Acidimicrobiales bacterium]|nr:LLM class flavin-dependent oxidoreductase [Acidimicrobiales bacterium]
MNTSASSMPAISLAAVPGRRRPVVEAAAEAERRGFTGIYCPSLGDAMGLCLSIAHATTTIPFGTSVQPIYLQHPVQLASQASYINEISEGRFRLGIGVSHGPVHKRLGADVGRPLTDTREYVAALRAAEPSAGPLPPITLATLRDKMVDLSVEVADGAVWANSSLNDMGRSVARIPQERRDNGFFVGNMLPTVIDDDREAAANRNRATLTGYVILPNYRNYWKQAGYEEEMTGIEQAIAAGEKDKITSFMSDKWLSSCTIYGSVNQVRDAVEAWWDLGVEPILVPSSTSGGQLKAIDEMFSAFA